MLHSTVGTGVSVISDVGGLDWFDVVELDWDEFPNSPWYRPVVIHDLDLDQNDISTTIRW